jgi:ATP-dependent Clp protease protease subunit
MVLPHSRVVLHQPSGGGQGTLPDLALHAKEIVRLRAQMEEILARHTGRDPAVIREDTERDLVLSAQEAVDYGLADGVLDPRKPPTST